MRPNFKYRNYFIGAAVILLSVAFSIRSSEGRIKLILADYPILIFVLGIVSSFFIVLYIRTINQKFESLSDQIKNISQHKSDDIEVQIEQLTDRQKEVYDLIMAGKTNKEIRSELYIEHSTLKTHINQIYKKLNIKNRKELKSKH